MGFEGINKEEDKSLEVNNAAIENFDTMLEQLEPVMKNIKIIQESVEQMKKYSDMDKSIPEVATRVSTQIRKDSNIGELLNNHEFMAKFSILASKINEQVLTIDSHIERHQREQ